MNIAKELREITRIIRIFDKKKYWQQFSASNLFYIELENYNVIFFFTDTINEDTFGMNFIHDKDGYNYLYDTLINKKIDLMQYYHIDAISLEVVYKSDLSYQDRKILKKQGLRTANVNVFLCNQKPGLSLDGCSNQEIHLVYKCLTYLEATLKKQLKQVTSNFKNNNHVFIKTIEENRELILSYGQIKIDEIKIPSKDTNQEYFNKLKNVSYIDEECICYTNYLPVLYKKNRPLIIIFYLKESNTLLLNMALTANGVYDTLYTTFERLVAIKDLPYRVIFNNRYCYSYLKNTLNSLKIEASFSVFNDFDIIFSHISELILRQIHDDVIIRDSEVDDFLVHLEDLFSIALDQEEKNEIDIKNLIQ